MMVSKSHLFLNDKEYYFNTLFGFGSNMECTNYQEVKICPGPDYQLLCSNFCWLWTNAGPWLVIDSTLPNNSSHMAHEASTLWLIASFILGLCASTSCIGTLLLLLSARVTHENRLLMLQYSPR